MWNKTRARRPLLIALLLAWWLACWWGTGIWRDKVATQVHDDARQRIEQFIATSIEGYERIIATRRGMLRVLARDQTYRDALSRHEPLSAAGDEDERRRRWNADPRLAAVSRQLNTTARDLGMRTIWLMDANGNCIASSNAGEPIDHVGTHYADRDYFQEARAGRSAHQVNIGRRQLGASISFSAPVTDRNGRVIGVLAGGNDLSTFTNWLDQADAFFTDRHGVVILSKDPAMILRALPNAPVHGYDAVTREKLYKTSDIQTLNLPSQGDDRFAELLRFTNGTVPAILGSRSVTDGEPVLHVLRPLPQLTDLEHRRAVNAGTLGLVGILFILLVAGTLRRRREQQAMALALAEREQKARQSRDFLDQMVNAIPDPVFVKDRAHRWVLMNNAFCELVGQPREKLIGKSDFDFFPEQQARVFWDKDELVFSAGIENVNEEKITGGQGDTRIIITKKSPVTTAEGEQFLVGIISDISARKQTERLLRAREREFRTLAENLPDIVIRYDRECRRLYVNPALATMAGAPPAELLGRPPQAHTPLVDSERYVAELRRAMDGGAPCSLEVQVRRANGELGWYLSSFVPEFDADGQVVGALVVARDITERRALEERLCASERELRTLMDNIPDLVLRYDRDRRRVYANPAWERTTGTKREEIVGTPPVGFGGDSKEVLPAYTQLLEDVIASGQAREFELQWPMRDGSTRWYHHRLVAELDETGAVVGAVVISNDVSERKRAERQLVLLKHAVEQSGEAFFLIDEAHRFIDVNRAACESLGYRREELLGKTPMDIDPDVTPEMLDRLMHKGGNVSRTLESSHRTRDGHVFPVEITGASFDVDGASYTIALARNIGARKRIENTLRFVADPGNTTDFLAALARHLGETLGVDHVVIGRLAEEPGIAETVACYAHGAIVPNMRYALADTPCANILGKCSCSYPRGVQALFPQDALLVDMGVDSYAGISVWDSTGKPIGLIAVMGAAPLQDETAVMQILQLVAPRVAAELARAESDRQLRAREQEFRTLAENLPVAVIRYDAGQHRRYLNPAAERMLHGSAAELLGHVPGGPTVPATPAMIAHYRGKMADVLATDAARELDFVLDALPADRQEHYEVRFVPEHGADGQTTGVLAIWYDITERKRAEDALCESLESLNEAQRVSHVGSWEFDLVGNVLVWSDEIFRIFEIDPKQFGASYEAFLHAIHPDDREAVNRVYAESLENRQPYEIEHRLLMADGRIKHVHEHCETYYAEDGKPLRSVGTVQDITERKHLEVELTDSRDFLGKVANSISDPVFVKDREHRWVLMNEAFCALVGQPRDVLLGKSDYDFLPKEQADVFWEKDEFVFESGETNVNEEAITGGDGALRHIQTKKTPFMSGDGQVLLVGVIRDITDRKRTEIALQENFDRIAELNVDLEKQALELRVSQEQLKLTEAWYRSILQSAPDGMLVIDRHGVIVQVNAQLEIMFGYEGRELIGNRVEMLLPAAIRDAHVGQRIDFVASGRTDRPMAAARHLRGCRKDGSEFPVDISLSQLPDIAGRVGVICAAIRDITSRRRMEDALHAREQEFRALIENSPDAVFRYDLDCRRIYVNPTVERLAGIPAATLLGKTPIEGLIDDINLGEKQLACIQQVQSTGAPVETELAWVHADGTLQQFHMYFVPEYGRDGQVTSVLAVGRDISARKLAEERLRKSHDILRALAAHQETQHEKERQELAYQIHEDLAQNLAALRMNISLFEMSGESVPGAPLLKTMSAIADSSIVRIRDIVSMLRPTVLDLGLVPALHWLTDDFKGVGFQFDLALPEDILLHDDASTFLFRAAQEALINIALHAAATHIHLSLDTVADVCRLVVRDNGCGFDPATPRREDSFGLIRLTEQARHLGGYLCIDSTSGQGTALEIHVPAFTEDRSQFSK